EEGPAPVVDGNVELDGKIRRKQDESRSEDRPVLPGMRRVESPEQVERGQHGREIDVEPDERAGPEARNAEYRRDGRVRRPQAEDGAQISSRDEPEHNSEQGPNGRAQEERLRLGEKGYEHAGNSFGAGTAFRVARIKSQFLRQRN